VNNIAKHAEAESVVITLLCHASGVKLDIYDDGIGFDPDHVTAEHLGLRIMQERAAALGAEWSLQTNPNQGTTICVCWTPPVTMGNGEPK
jgi:signal transduction histidine kinase